MAKCPKCSMVYSGKLPSCPGCGYNLKNAQSDGDFVPGESKVIQDLFSMARNISSTLDLDALLKKIGLSAERLLNAEASSIMLKAEDSEELYFKTATGEKSSEIKLMKVPVGKGIAGWVAKEKKPLIVNDVDSDRRFTRDFDKASGFQTRSIIAVPMVVDNELVGVAEVLNKVGSDGFTQSDMNLLVSLAGLAAVAVLNAKLVENQKNFFTNVIELLTTAIESKDPGAGGHSFRVAQISCAIAKRLGVTDADYKLLYYSAMLHDIGFLRVNCSSLSANELNSRSEMVQYQMHPVVGSEMIKGIKMLNGASEIIRHHHAYIDGSGINDTASAEEIPLASKILSLIEDVEEIKAKNIPLDKYFSDVEKLVKQGSGKKYDTRVAKAFLEEHKIAKESILY